MAEETPSQAGMISLAQASRLLGLTDRRVQQLAKEGYIPKPSRGMYPLVGAVQGYIRFLRDEARKGSQAENGLKATRQAEIEMRMAEKRRDLVARAEANAAMDEVVGEINEQFGGFPARVTRDAAFRREIEKALDVSINAIADRLAGAKRALATGGADDPAQAEDVA